MNSYVFFLSLGELDFWINSDLNWAIELLRLGSKKGAHLDKLRTNGSYAALLPSQWRVIDFRTPGSSPHRTNGYVAVIVDADFRGATVQFEHRSKDMHIKFQGSI